MANLKYSRTKDPWMLSNLLVCCDLGEVFLISDKCLQICADVNICWECFEMKLSVVGLIVEVWEKRFGARKRDQAVAEYEQSIRPNRPCRRSESNPARWRPNHWASGSAMQWFRASNSISVQARVMHPAAQLAEQVAYVNVSCCCSSDSDDLNKI